MSATHQLDVEAIAQRYLGGETEQSISISLGVGTGTIKRRLIAAGIDRRNRQEATFLRYGYLGEKSHSERHARYRRECIQHYGGKCSCCGQPNLKYLVIDHIEDDGNIHRLTFSGPIYGWLRARHYPKGYQVLCSNCNMAKAYYGGCLTPCGAYQAVDITDEKGEGKV